MTTEYLQQPPSEPPSEPPRKRRHPVRWILLILGAIVVLAIAGSALAGPSAPARHTQRPATAATSVPAYTPPPAPPAPTASPDGTYEGSCDTSLGAGISDPNYLTGEVDLANTGNVGTVIRVRFAWKQEAYPSIVMFKTVRTRPGQHYVVRFHYYAGTFDTSTAPLDRNQTWEEDHGFRDACSYRATITKTFGQVQSS